MERKTMRMKRMHEDLYRQSRVARALSDPARFQILHLLFKEGPLSPSDISGRLQRALPTVSFHLNRLQENHLVRHERQPRGVIYWVKYQKETRNVLGSLEQFVERSVVRIKEDV